MVAPPLHDVINAPVKHVALQLVFYAVPRAPVCHPKDLFGSSTWLQQNASMQLKFALVMPKYAKVNATNASRANIL